MTEEKAVYCPKCGGKLVRIGRLVDGHKKCMGILEYDVCCNQCDTAMTVEDRSSFEQEGKIVITFT